MLNKCLNTVSICEIGNHRQLYRSLQKNSRRFQQGKGHSRGILQALWNVASVDCSITDYGGDDEDGDKYSGPVSGGGRRGHQLLQSRGQWQHSAAPDTDVVLSTPAAQSGRGTQDMSGSWQSINQWKFDTELHQAPHLVSSLPAGPGTHTDSASTPPLPPRALQPRASGGDKHSLLLSVHIYIEAVMKLARGQTKL